MNKTVRHRGKWTRSRPDAPPSCPGCGGRLDFSQPDADRPDELLGTCDKDGCREWVILSMREDRWMILDRISAHRRDPANPHWKPARPATRETARR